mmetsp:Transcript_67091/g.192903  ORF Transcript_67091/g.192903 Transcript_67091/m.192903 type:complete len:252 (-) Transcript_67091:1985-2740(-)
MDSLPRRRRRSSRNRKHSPILQNFSTTTLRPSAALPLEWVPRSTPQVLQTSPTQAIVCIRSLCAFRFARVGGERAALGLLQLLEREALLRARSQSGSESPSTPTTSGHPRADRRHPLWRARPRARAARSSGSCLRGPLQHWRKRSGGKGLSVKVWTSKSPRSVPPRRRPRWPRETSSRGCPCWRCGLHRRLLSRPRPETSWRSTILKRHRTLRMRRFCVGVSSACASPGNAASFCSTTSAPCDERWKVVIS